MAKLTATPVAQLKVGDIVHFYGGRFEVQEDARELQCYRPESAHLTVAPGPVNGAVARAVCIEGSVPGYFEPGADWTFQGTHAGLFAVRYQVETNV